MPLCLKKQCYCSAVKLCLTLRPHGLQHTRLPCSSLSPGICSNSCPLSQWRQPTISSSVIPSIKKYLIAKNANHLMTLQRIIAVTLKITDHRYQSKYHNEKVWNITQITKMWLRDTSWANTVGKLMPINCLSAGLPQTFNRRKTQCLQSSVNQRAIKLGLPVIPQILEGELEKLLGKNVEPNEDQTLNECLTR